MSASYPVPLLATSYGSLAYSTNDLADELSTEDYIAQQNLEDLTSKFAPSTSFGALRTPLEGQRSLLYGRSMREGIVTTDKNGFLVESMRGRKTVTINEFVKHAQLERPDIVVAMAHEVPCGSTDKHRKASRELSRKWYDVLYQSNNIKNIYPMLLVHDTSATTESKLVSEAKTLAASGATGLCLGCVNLPSGTDSDGGLRILKLIREAIGPKLSIVYPRANTLPRILGAIDSGATLISTNAPHELMSCGLAALWATSCLDVKPLSHHTMTQSNKQILGVPYLPVKRDIACVDNSETDNGGSSSSNNSSNSCNDAMHIWMSQKTSKQKTSITTMTRGPLYLNINDPVYATDNTPLSSQCDCHACRNHTRAYIHHLLLAHELLGSILLYTHNQRQVVLLCKTARQLIGDGRDSKFREWLDSFKI